MTPCRPTSLLALAALCALAACDGEPESTSHFVWPMDGETAIAVSDELLVYAPGFGYPDDYPMPELLSVVDLVDGGFVDGEIIQDEAGLHFVPFGGWRLDRRYVWTVDVPHTVPHGPELSLPESLQGSAVFDTSGRVDVLAAGIDDEERACLVLSRSLPNAEFPALRMTIDDVETELLDAVVVPPEAWPQDHVVADLDPAVDLLCVTTAQPAAVDARIRVWLGDDGPWNVPVDERHPAELVTDRHRGGQR